MSRHRNVRNLIGDDYLDDYGDDYDDGYYDEEEDDDYYYEQQQQRKKREEEEAKRRAQAITDQATAKKAASVSAAAAAKGTRAGGSTAFPSKQQHARAGAGQAGTPTAGGITAPPPGFGGPPSPASLSGKKQAARGQQKAAVLAFDATPPVGYKTKAAIKQQQPKLPGGEPLAVVASLSSSAPSNTKRYPRQDVSPTSPSALKDPPRQLDATVSASTPSQNSPTQQQQQPPESAAAAAPAALPKQLPAEVIESLKKQRSRLSMVVLGHVDAGKSTLMGQVLLQLGHVEKRTVTKYQRQAAELGKASFALAWVMDEDDSERQRGVTMDVGTKYMTTPNHDITILDAPGHADFIPAMITGAASADVGLLVVAATPGEFEAGFGHVGEEGGGGGGGQLQQQQQQQQQQSVGQTREHIILSRGLGVSQLIVAVNKLDAADPPWSKERFDHIQSKLLPFLQMNGFNPRRIQFVPISGLSGINIKEKPSPSAEGLRDWYDGPTLLEAIDNFVPAQRNIGKPFRMIVSDVYQEGKGVTARGRVVQGAVQIGDRIVILPIGDEAVVGKIEHGTATIASSPYSYATASTSNDNGNDDILDRMKFAVAGDSVEILLSGIDIARIASGSVLSHTNKQLRPPVKKRIQAKVLIMDKIDVPIIRGAQALLHMHSIDVPAVITKLISTTKRDGTTKQDNPRVLTGGASAVVEIKMSEKICMEEFSDCRSLGRFVLRRGGDTIAVGVIEKILG